MPATVSLLAQRVADSRKALIDLFQGNLGLIAAFDLMQVDPGLATAREREFAALVVDTQTTLLREADLILADADMCTLVDVAAASMPDQVLREDDPITRRGFLMFADPLPDRTGVGLSPPLRALSWAVLPADHPLIAQAQIGSAVLLTAYVSTAEMAALNGWRMPPRAPTLTANATVLWEVGLEIGQTYTGARTDPETARLARPDFYQTTSAAFWALAKQPLTSEEPVPLARKQQQRHQRAGIVRPEQPVRVVSLRHRQPATPAGGEPTGRHVTVRSLVRGHWKRAYRPSVQDHRLVYVAPHIRGPEGAPLLGGEKVLLARGDAPPTRSPG